MSSAPNMVSVTFSMPEEERAKLEGAAWRLHKSRAALLRIVIQEYFDRNPELAIPDDRASWRP